jgi:hypothetical protein
MNRSSPFVDGLVLAFLVCATAGAAAQSPRIQLEKGDDLRQAFVKLAQKARNFDGNHSEK